MCLWNLEFLELGHCLLLLPQEGHQPQESWPSHLQLVYCPQEAGGRIIKERRMAELLPQTHRLHEGSPQWTPSPSEHLLLLLRKALSHTVAQKPWVNPHVPLRG